MAKVGWEEMTAIELKAAAAETGGLCLLPIGCLEKHGEHLPIGTDVICAEAIARAAARIEPAVVFPVQHLAVTNELKCWEGVIATPTHLLIRMWENLCDEISRNGFHKIVLANFHGGNRFLMGQFIIECMDRRKDYALYWPRDLTDPPIRRELMETEYEAHAGEMETSVMLHVRPDLVRMDLIAPPEAGVPKRDFDLGGDVYTSADWYSLHPTHYAGDARPATPAKGKAMFEAMVARLAETVRRIKADSRVPDLLAEYYDRSESHRDSAGAKGGRSDAGGPRRRTRR